VQAILAEGSKQKSGRRGRESGVTLIELLVAITVFVILSTLAVPAFEFIMASSHVADESNSLASTLWAARSAAIENGEPVTVCASSNGASCTDTAWQNGWIVFTDYNNDQTVDQGDPIRQIRSAFTSTDTVAPSEQISSITFNREGFAVGIPDDITFEFHNSTNNNAITRCVLLQRMGTALAESYGTGSCQ
jgi:type IV fimbrial biogenesis protein FimT